MKLQGQIQTGPWAAAVGQNPSFAAGLQIAAQRTFAAPAQHLHAGWNLISPKRVHTNQTCAKNSEGPFS